MATFSQGDFLVDILQFQITRSNQGGTTTLYTVPAGHVAAFYVVGRGFFQTFSAFAEDPSFPTGGGQEQVITEEDIGFSHPYSGSPMFNEGVQFKVTASVGAVNPPSLAKFLVYLYKKP